MDLKFGDIQETALITLAIRASETARPNPRIRDPKAKEIIDISADVFMTSIMLSMCIVGPILAAIQFTDSSAKVSTTVATVDQLLASEEQEHSDTPVTLATHNIEFCDVSYAVKKPWWYHDIEPLAFFHFSSLFVARRNLQSRRL